jgi:hypothetical protein
VQCSNPRRSGWSSWAKQAIGTPKFLPELPKRELARLEAIVEREATKYWRRVERAHHGKASRHRQRTTIKNN